MAVAEAAVQETVVVVLVSIAMNVVAGDGGLRRSVHRLSGDGIGGAHSGSVSSGGVCRARDGDELSCSRPVPCHRWRWLDEHR